MSPEQNKTLVREAVEAFNRNDPATVNRLFAADYVDHDPSRAGLPPGPEGVKRAWNAIRAAFPDLRATIEDTIAEGDRVAVRGEIRGTHRGQLMGILPAGGRVEWTGISITRHAGGKIVEQWGGFDALGLLQQLGAVPQRAGG